MKQVFQKNYQNIRDLITNNVDTILKLVEQAKGLETIIEGMSTSESELKGQLEKQIVEIRNTISTLTDQTEQLFKSYDSMIEDTFKSS